MFGKIETILKAAATPVIELTTLRGFTAEEGKFYTFKGVMFFLSGNEWYTSIDGKAVMLESNCEGDGWL